MARLTGVALLQAAEGGEGSVLTLLKQRVEELGGYAAMLDMPAEVLMRMHVAVQRWRPSGPVGVYEEKIKGKRVVDVDVVREVYPDGAADRRQFVGDVSLKTKPAGAWTPMGMVEDPEAKAPVGAYEDKREETPRWLFTMAHQASAIERVPVWEGQVRIPYRFTTQVIVPSTATEMMESGKLESGANWIYHRSDPHTGKVWLEGQVQDWNEPYAPMVVSPGLASFSTNLRCLGQVLLDQRTQTVTRPGGRERVVVLDLIAAWIEGAFEKASADPPTKNLYLEKLWAERWTGGRKVEPPVERNSPGSVMMDVARRARVRYEDEIRGLERTIEGYRKLVEDTTRLVDERKKAPPLTEIKTPEEQLMGMIERGEINDAMFWKGRLYVLVHKQRMVVTPKDVEEWMRSSGFAYSDADKAKRIGIYEAPGWTASFDLTRLGDTRVWAIGEKGEAVVSRHPHVRNGGTTGLPCWGEEKTMEGLNEAIERGDLVGMVRVLKGYMGTIHYGHGYSPPWDWATKVGELEGYTRPKVKVTVVKKAKVTVVRPPTVPDVIVTTPEDDDDYDDDYVEDDEVEVA